MTKEVLEEKKLIKLQKDTFSYFLKEINLENGLVPDSTKKDSPCSVTAVGLALSSYTVAVEIGLIRSRRSRKANFDDIAVLLGRWSGNRE